MRFINRWTLAARISGIYFVVGALWILLSDAILYGTLLPNDITLSVLEVVKGWFYVTLTTAMLYWLLQQEGRKQRAYQDKLQQTERRLRFILDNMGDMAWAVDLQTHQPVFVSEAAQSIFGCTPQQFMQEPDRWVDTVHPDDRERFKVQRDALEQEGKRDTTYRLKLPDGRLRHVHDRAWVISADGQGKQAIGLVTDISYLRELDDARQAQEQLELSLRKELKLRQLRGQFLSMVSHEFKGPLTSAHMSAQVLDRYGERLALDDTRKHTDRISHAVQELTDMLNDLLNIWREDTTNGEVQMHPLNVAALCQDWVQAARDNAPDNIDLQLETPPLTLMPQTFTIEGDERLLFRAVRNLLSNAIKYSPDGGAVQITLTQTNNDVQIAVRDEGIGIPADDLPNLFKSFKRARNTVGISGTGLGLVIAKQAVELHGGSISVQSIEGEGTTFTIILPCQQPVIEPLVLDAGD